MYEYNVRVHTICRKLRSFLKHLRKSGRCVHMNLYGCLYVFVFEVFYLLALHAVHKQEQIQMRRDSKNEEGKGVCIIQALDR